MMGTLLRGIEVGRVWGQRWMGVTADRSCCRFAIGCFGVEDLAEEADVRHIITPTPLIVDEGCNSSRASLQRAFQVAPCPWTWDRGSLHRN